MEAPSVFASTANRERGIGRNGFPSFVGTKHFNGQPKAQFEFACPLSGYPCLMFEHVTTNKWIISADLNQDRYEIPNLPLQALMPGSGNENFSGMFWNRQLPRMW
jgi:hypothetical protein